MGFFKKRTLTLRIDLCLKGIASWLLCETFNIPIPRFSWLEGPVGLRLFRCTKWLFLVNVASIRRAVVLLVKSSPMSGINRQEAVRTEWTRRSAPSQVGLTGMGRPTSRRDSWTTFSDQTKKNRSGFVLFSFFLIQFSSLSHLTSKSRMGC